MMYRMKQNAVGLSNICILSTCVLVTLSSTVNLFIGEEDILRARYPRQIITSCVVETRQSGEQLVQASRRHAKDYGISVQNNVGYANFNYPARCENGEFSRRTAGMRCMKWMPFPWRITTASWAPSCSCPGSRCWWLCLKCSWIKRK